MKLAVIIQARMFSTRLPGKVMLPVNGEPLLAAMVRRVRGVNTPFEVCVATTVNPEDDEIARTCSLFDIPVHRGHPTDLLERLYSAARELRVDAVAKIPSSCPLVDSAAIQRVLTKYCESADEYDYVSNLHPATYPDGNDVEVMSFDVLEMAHTHAKRAYDRQYVTPFIWERPEIFRLGNVLWGLRRDYSMTHRFALEYIEDYSFIRRVFEEIGGSKAEFGIDDILELIARKPDIAQINACHVGVSRHRHHLHDWRGVSSVTPSEGVLH
jgi:spore coat polysaccharide biosynthesis protein SpsF